MGEGYRLLIRRGQLPPAVGGFELAWPCARKKAQGLRRLAVRLPALEPAFKRSGSPPSRKNENTAKVGARGLALSVEKPLLQRKRPAGSPAFLDGVATLLKPQCRPQPCLLEECLAGPSTGAGLRPARLQCGWRSGSACPRSVPWSGPLPRPGGFRRAG